MTNCVIIDDDAFYIEIIKNYCAKLNINVISTYQNPVLVLAEIEKLSECDIIFLDINMPDISGFDILKYKPAAQVIITSADDTNAVKSFDYEIADYLKKPFELERFIRAVKKAKENIENSQKMESHLLRQTSDSSNTLTLTNIYVNVNKKLIKLNINDINIIEAKGDYVLIKLQDSNNLIVHTTLKKIMQKLPPELFFQVHRSFIVNLKKIIDIEDSTIVIDRNVIPISKRRMKPLKDILHILD